MGAAVPLLAFVFVCLIWVGPGLFVPLPESLDYDHSNANCFEEKSCDRLDLRENENIITDEKFTYMHSRDASFFVKLANNALQFF